MHVYTCTFLPVYICTCMCTLVHVCACMCVQVCASCTCAYVCAYACTCICVCTWLCVHMLVCAYVYSHPVCLYVCVQVCAGRSHSCAGAEQSRTTPSPAHHPHSSAPKGEVDFWKEPCTMAGYLSSWVPAPSTPASHAGKRSGNHSRQHCRAEGRDTHQHFFVPTATEPVQEDQVGVTALGLGKATLAAVSHCIIHQGAQKLLI